MTVIMEWEIGLENGHKDVKVIVQYTNEDCKMLQWRQVLIVMEKVYCNPFRLN
jgi:hypothetical protein